MLRNILNKSSAKQKERQKADILSTSTRRSSDSVSTKSSTVSALKQGTKIKLASMVDRLQKSTRRLGLRRKKNSKETNGFTTATSIDNCQSKPKKLAHNSESDQDDDDDDAYKSADDDTGRYCDLATKDNNEEQIQSKKANKSLATIQNAPIQDSRKSSMDDDKILLPEEQCDIPTFLQTKNCDQFLIDETRRLLKERFQNNPDSFYDADYKRMLNDDWTVTRFLLRRRLDPKRTAKLMEECGRFRKQYRMSEVKLWEFPTEFHRAGGLFQYAPDRVGNITMYMRVKMYRRVPEISDVFKAFILCVLEECDVANNGRGTAVVFDLSGCSLQNVDLGFLSWLLSSFRNYCPKGVSYILVFNLPWILNATCKLAMTWMSASNKRALRFVYGDEIENFIARENLPDYCGGTCKIDYTRVPKGSRPAIELCDRFDMTKEQALKIRELFKEYLKEEDFNDDKLSEKTTLTKKQLEAKSAIVNNQKERSETARVNANGLVQAQQQLNIDTNGTTVAMDQQQATNVVIPVSDLVSQASRFIAQ